MSDQPKPPNQEKKVDKGKRKVDALTSRKKSDKGKGMIVMNLISHDQIEESLNEGFTYYALVAQKAEQKITLNQSWKSFSKSSQKICEVSYLPCETFNMLLT